MKNTHHVIVCILSISLSLCCPPITSSQQQNSGDTESISIESDTHKKSIPLKPLHTRPLYTPILPLEPEPEEKQPAPQ